MFFYGLISQDWPCTSDSSSSQILGLQACITIRSCYSIINCNLVKMDFVDFKFFPFLLSHKIVHIPLLVEHKDFNKFQVSFNVHILFLSPSSCVEQSLVILPNHDDSHEHIAFCPASPMCTRSSCTHTQPVSLPFADSLWSRLPVVKCLRNSRM